MYETREIAIREFWGRQFSTEKIQRPGSTYRELAERECSGENTKDLRETTGDNEKCGL